MSDIQWWQTVGQYAVEPPAWTRLYDKTRKEMPKISDMIESKYLKQSDVGDEEVIATVAAIPQNPKKVNVARDDEAPDYRWLLKFNEFAKPMILNVTNLKRIGKALGDDTADWAGNSVIVYVDHYIEFGGNVVGGLRIKGIPRKAARPAAKSVDDINAELNGGDVPF